MKILFAGGGTLGPVTPLLAVIDELKRVRPDIECVFVGTPDGPERRLVQEMGVRFVALDTPKFRRYFDVRTLLAPLHFAWAVGVAMRLLMKEKPCLVVGAGGYVQVPLGLAAKLCGIKVLLHQQDVIASLSNRLLAPFTDAITTTFEVSLRDFPKRKTSVIGNPVRRAIEEGERGKGLSFLGFSGERPVLLILGGGTGSAFLNGKIIEALPLLTGFADVVHLTGLQKAVMPPRIDHPERYRQMDFIAAEMADVLAAADVVLCRAGTGTLTECAARSKAVILVPIAGSQQERNAEFVVDRGGAKMFHEREVQPDTLMNVVRELHRRPEEARRLGSALHALFRPNARAALAEKISFLVS